MVTKVGGKTARHVDFRLISATNVDLRENVRSGQFRRDLFYRVNVLVIDVPPLRARGDDVVEIAEALITSHPDERYRNIKLTPKAADRLRAHSFPGNVRELEQAVRRTILGREYSGSQNLSRDLPPWLNAAALGELTATQLLADYCEMLYQRDGTYEAVAAVTGLDRRTVKKYIG